MQFSIGALETGLSIAHHISSLQSSATFQQELHEETRGGVRQVALSDDEDEIDGTKKEHANIAFGLFRRRRCRENPETTMVYIRRRARVRIQSWTRAFVMIHRSAKSIC